MSSPIIISQSFTTQAQTSIKYNIEQIVTPIATPNQSIPSTKLTTRSAKAHWYNPVDTQQALHNAEAYKKGIDSLFAKYPGMPESIKKQLSTQYQHYKRKGGRNRPFLQADLTQLEAKIIQSTKEASAAWDQAVIRANLNKSNDNIRIDGQNLSKIINNKKIFEKTPINIISSKLGQQPSSQESKQVKSLVEEMFNNSAMGHREKLICMDACISHIIHNRNKGPATVLQTPHLQIIGNKIVVNKPVHIESMVFQGGGAKGVGYAGMLKKMNEANQLNHLKQVGGSSAGALAATAVAIGISSENFLQFVDDIQAAKDKPGSEIQQLYDSKHPMFKMLNFKNKKSALGIIELIDQKSSNQVTSFLKEIKLNELDLSEEDKKRLQSLMNLTELHTEDNMITFNDLKILSKINISNNPFKELTITGWDATHQQELYFNAENTPNMPIAYANRISMSLPNIFQSPTLNVSRFGGKYAEKQNLSGPAQLFDGGLGSNSPSEMFVNATDPLQSQLQQQNTLTCIFDEGGEAHRATSTADGKGFQYATGASGLAQDVFVAVGGAKTKVSQNRAIENKKLDNLGQIMIVGHGQLGTTSFGATQEQKEAANMVSEALTQQWIDQHENEYARIELATLPEGKNFEQLSEEQKNELQEQLRNLAEQLNDHELQKIISQIYDNDGLNAMFA